MPIHFPIIRTNISKSLIRSAPSQISKAALPLVTVPIAAYYIGESRDRAAKRVVEFFNDKGIDLPRVLEPDPTGKGGYSEATKTDLRLAISNAEKDGIIATDDKKLGNRLVSFTGKSPEENPVSMQDLSKNPEMINDMSPEDILNIDTSLPPELEAFSDSSLDNIPDGLMENIADAIPEGFSVDNDMLSIARGWLADIAGDAGL